MPRKYVAAEGRLQEEDPGGATAEERLRERDPASNMLDDWMGV
jgi:hypothetical protein